MAEKPLLLMVWGSSPTGSSWQALEAAGFACLAASDRTEALSLARARAPAFAVVGAQSLGWRELCRALAAEPATSDIRVVIASDAPVAGERADALEAGADGYAALDGGPAELVATLRALRRRAGGVQERKALERRLRESEALESRLGECGLFGTFRWDRAGTLTEANDTFLGLLGYAREDLVAGRLNAEAISAPEGRGADQQTLRELRERGVCQPYEKQYLQKGGGRVDVLFGGVACDGGAEEGGLAFVVNITSHKRTERVLRHREQELRTVADNTPDVIARFDRDGRHLFVSRSIERFTGRSPELFLGFTHAELDMPPALVWQWEEALGRAVKGEDVSFELELETPDGPRCLLSRLVPERDEVSRVTTVLSISRDITERKRAEAAIRESEDRLRMSVESTGLGTWDRNLLTGVARWDEQCKTLFGLPADAEVSFDILLAAVHPDDRERVRQAIRRVQDPASGRELNVEFRAIGVRDGVVRWLVSRGRMHLDAQGRPYRFSGTTLDITQSKVAEESLRRLAALVENSNDFIGMTSLEGEVTFLNDAGRRLVGLERLEDTGRLRITDFLAPEDAAVWARDVLPAAVATGRWQGEFRLRHLSTGELVPIDHALFLIREPGTGEPIALATVSRDITRQKEDAERLRRQADFEQRIIGIVSHDLRSPLQAISASAFLLTRMAQLPERAVTAARRISSTSEKMQRMVEDLLDFTRAHLGTGIPVYPRPCDLHALLYQAVDEVETGRPGRRVALRIDGAGAGHWDAGRLLQLLSNLLSNALNYSPEDSVVELECRGDADAVELAVRNRNKAGPIAPHELGNLFQPFKRLETGSKERVQGLGLGLYIVEQIVLGHGGTVGVESNAEHGTTFRVRLPREVDARAMSSGA